MDRFAIVAGTASLRLRVFAWTKSSLAARTCAGRPGPACASPSVAASLAMSRGSGRAEASHRTVARRLPPKRRKNILRH